jgi:Flp pilus assembly protein TadG
MIRRLGEALRGFRRETRGSITIEFAMSVPVMITVYFGVVTFGNGFATKQRLETLSRTVADLAGRLPPVAPTYTSVINATEVTNIATAAAAIMAPYDARGLTMTLASIVVRPQGSSVVGKVCWSASRRVAADGTLETVAVPAQYTVNAVVTVPEGYRIAGNSYLVSDVEQVYRPVIGHAITGDINLRDTVPWPSRNGLQVIWQGQPACPTT